MYDVVVVGAGVQGLCTARYLAKCNVKTLLIDKHEVPHSYGSSKGKSRGIRYAYDTLHHAAMVKEAHQLWIDLAKESELELYIKTGLICLLSDEKLDVMTRTLKTLGLSHEVLKSSEVDRQFVGFNSGGLNGIFDGNAGLLKSDLCIRALLESYNKHGGLFKVETVHSVKPINENMVEVKTNKNIHVGKSVVLTCGPWINNVLKPLDLHLPITIHKVLAVYWRPRNEGVYSHKVFPLSCVDTSEKLWYSTPEMEYEGLMKVAYHGGPILTDADDMDGNDAEEGKIIEELRSLVAKHYPNLIPVPAHIEICFYSMTPDEDFLLDRHPRHSNVIIGAGFSGHGFKMAPVVGGILGDLALKRKNKHCLTHYSIDRFAEKLSKI